MTGMEALMTTLRGRAGEAPYKAIKRQERTRKLSYTKLKKQNPFTRAANIEPNFHVSNENDSEVII